MQFKKTVLIQQTGLLNYWPQFQHHFKYKKITKQKSEPLSIHKKMNKFGKKKIIYLEYIKQINRICKVNFRHRTGGSICSPTLSPPPLIPSFTRLFIRPVDPILCKRNCVDFQNLENLDFCSCNHHMNFLCGLSLLTKYRLLSGFLWWISCFRCMNKVCIFTWFSSLVM